MSDDEKLVDNLKCKYCKKSIQKTSAKCVTCSAMYHTSCALRIAGLVAVGKGNYVKCCPNNESEVNNPNDQPLRANNIKAFETLSQELQKCKTEILKELHEKEKILCEKIQNLEQTLKGLQGNLEQNQVNPATLQNKPVIRSLTADQPNGEVSNIRKRIGSRSDTQGRPNLNSKHKQEKLESNQPDSNYVNISQKDKNNSVTLSQVSSAIENALVQTEKQEEPFILVKHRPRASRGSAKNVNDLLPAAESRRWLYIGKVASTVNAETVENYIKNKITINNGRDLIVEQLRTIGNTNSFKVGITSEIYEDINKCEFWPSGVIFRRFNFKRQFHNNKKAANFQPLADNQVEN